MVDTLNKVLHLSNVLHVPKIRKNLMLVLQFARENNVFFEFHPYHCLVMDIETQVVLMQGCTHDGLYKFSTVVSNKEGGTPSANSTSLRSSSGLIMYLSCGTGDWDILQVI